MPETFLGRYVALGFLGKGSMGQVWLAHPLGQPDKRVVVKVMHPHIASQPRFRQLFQREIQSMQRLEHPYIVKLLDSSIDDARGPSLVMEYVPGVTLESLLDEDTRLPVGHVGLLLGYLCHALEAAHGIGIVHRDLKPANLMVLAPRTFDESIRVMDFGLAQFAGKPHFTAERLAGAAQKETSGTPSYISPEALRGDEIDSRADLYSLGIMLYEMLTGHLPFEHVKVERMLHAHLTERPRSFASLGLRDIPSAVEAVVQLCLSKYAVERPRSAREVARQFGLALGIDIWEAATAEDADAHNTVTPARKPVVDRNAIVHELDAWMPERIAVVKLRGFLEDIGGKVVASEPGLLKIRMGRPPVTKSGRIDLVAIKGQKPPVEIELRMNKPSADGNLLAVTVLFRPYTDACLLLLPDWRNHCQNLYKDLQSYLMAR